MPAVLLEVGNIIDPDDESIISTSGFRQQFSLVIKAALDAYFATSRLSKQTAEQAYSACFFL